MSNTGAIPNSVMTPMGLPMGYARRGLVLMIDALCPRRDGTLPGQSNIWEDLSRNRYDVTFSRAVNLGGSAAIDISNVSGTSDLPKNPYYAVEIVAVPTDAFTCYLYSNNEYGAFALSKEYNAFAKANPVYGCWYRRRNISNDVDITKSLSVYFGVHGSRFYINGRQYDVDDYSLPPTSWGLMNGASLINDRTNSGARISAMRVYDRELSREEILHHWLLDKKRFNLQ